MKSIVLLLLILFSASAQSSFVYQKFIDLEGSDAGWDYNEFAQGLLLTSPNHYLGWSDTDDGFPRRYVSNIATKGFIGDGPDVRISIRDGAIGQISLGYQSGDYINTAYVYSENDELLASKTFLKPTPYLVFYGGTGSLEPYGDDGLLEIPFDGVAAYVDLDFNVDNAPTDSEFESFVIDDFRFNPAGDQPLERHRGLLRAVQAEDIIKFGDTVPIVTSSLGSGGSAPMFFQTDVAESLMISVSDNISIAGYSLIQPPGAGDIYADFMVKTDTEEFITNVDFNVSNYDDYADTQSIILSGVSNDLYPYDALLHGLRFSGEGAASLSFQRVQSVSEPATWHVFMLVLIGLLGFRFSDDLPNWLRAAISE